MASQLNNLSATLPPVGTVAVVPGSLGGFVPFDAVAAAGTPLPPPLPAGAIPPGAVAGGGSTQPSIDDPRMVAALSTLLTLLNQLLAATGGAQAGAAGIATGGGAAMSPEDTLVSLRAAAGGNGSGIGGGASWSGAYALGSSGGTVTGGGPGASGGGDGVASLMGGASIGGATGRAWTIVDSTGAPSVTPEAAPNAAATGGGALAAPAAAPQIDYRRMTGTPQLGGVIDTIVKTATPMAIDARSEGTWLVVTDAAGAQLQVHTHGRWAGEIASVQSAVQQGLIQVHLHPDGTLHLHDVA